MALFMFGSQGTNPSSTQGYLGTVALCPSCKGQRQKDLFKKVDGVDICKNCQDDLDQETKDLQ